MLANPREPAAVPGWPFQRFFACFQRVFRRFLLVSDFLAPHRAHVLTAFQSESVLARKLKPKISSSRDARATTDAAGDGQGSPDKAQGKTPDRKTPDTEQGKKAVGL